MKNNYMHQLDTFTIGDIKTLEHRFSRMAEQGWMIDKIGFRLRYRAIDPCNKCFFVDLLPQITAFDYPENEDAQDYRSICEESGWTFVAASRKLHVFCADRDNNTPIPIHTDNALQAKMYLKTCRKNELLVLLYALVMLYFSFPARNGVDLFLSNISLFMTIGYCFLLTGVIWTVGFVLRWYIRTMKSAKYSLPLPKVNYRLSRLRSKVLLAGFIAFIVCVILGIAFEILGGMPIVILTAIIGPLSAFAVGLWIRRQIDTKRRTRTANIKFSIITIAVLELVLLSVLVFILPGPILLRSDTLDNRPVLSLNDVGIAETPDNFNTRIKGTFAVPVDYEYWEINRQGRTQTHVYSTISKALTRLLYDQFTVKRAEQLQIYFSTTSRLTIMTADEAAFWGAQEGVAQFFPADNTAEFLFLNGKTMLSISVSADNMDLEIVRQGVKNLWNDIFDLADQA